MSCPCNASATRFFARGLVQVHRPGPGTLLVLPLRASPVHRSIIRPQSGYRQQQFLHLSRALRSDASSNPAVSNRDPRRSFDQQPRGNRFHRKGAIGSSDRLDSAKTPRIDTDAAKPDAEPMSEAEKRARRAYRFEKEGFDWKSFRSNDPETRKKADTANFDWENWKGDGFASKNPGLNDMLKKLKDAQDRDRQAVGLSPQKQEANNDLSDDYAAKPRTSPHKATKPTGSPERKSLLAPGKKLPATRREHWRVQKEALKAKFPNGWMPHKRLSPDALAGIRALNAQFPAVYTTETLAEKFEVSPEAIRRILRTHWQPKPEEEEKRQERWFRRGLSVWQQKAELGINPPKRWRDEGIVCDPEIEERRVRAAKEMNRVLDEAKVQYRDKYNLGGPAADGVGDEVDSRGRDDGYRRDLRGRVDGYGRDSAGDRFFDAKRGDQGQQRAHGGKQGYGARGDGQSRNMREGRQDKGRQDKGRQDKGKQDKGRQDKGKQDKGRQDKGRHRDKKDKGRHRDRKGQGSPKEKAQEIDSSDPFAKMKMSRR